MFTLIDLKQGTLIWKWLTKEWVNSSAVSDGSVMYIGSNDRHLYAIGAKKGDGKWNLETHGPVISRPAIYKNIVIAAGGSGDGAIYWVEKDTGKQIWKYTTEGKIEADPVVVGDKLFVASSDGILYAFNMPSDLTR
ncbi:MAG: PQQ-binding-like beta-propeller repeat protein [Myxococcota bacterium]